MSDRVPPAPATGPIPLHIETEVSRRYADGALQCETELCCPVPYDPRYLEVIPREVIERDYGCGDPSRHVHEGEVVLDLGSGSGKACFIASQIVGPEGKVIGVDMTPEMLALARRNAPIVAERIGYSNVTFLRGHIQDLKLDLERLGEYLALHPTTDVEAYVALQARARQMGEEQPMIPAGSVDVVISNCVLNLVRPEDKGKLFGEIFRVLRPRGGRAVISDIVSDEDIPAHLKRDPKLWSGCISGAFREDLFLKAFEDVGFHGVRILDRGDKPWATVEGIEFRALTVEAFTGKAGPCLERHQAVLYKGPWKEVKDDDGHALRRGEPTAVCDKTYHLYQSEPYRDCIAAIPPRNEVPVEAAERFDCSRSSRRHARETKGLDYDASEGCKPGESCC